MSETSVVVTGASGFVGGHLAEHLGRGRHNVIGLDRRRPIDGDDFILADLLDLGDNTQALEALRGATHVVHLAAEAYVPLSLVDPHLYVQNNVVATVNLLEALKGSAALERFLLVSSCEVYGTTRARVEESSAPRPASPYAASKLGQEIFCAAAEACQGLPLVTARLFNNYGPRQQENRLIPSILRALETGTTFTMTGDGSQTRDWIDVRDTVDALTRLLFTDGVLGEVFNVSAENEVSVRDVVQLVQTTASEALNPIDRVPSIPGFLRRSTGSSAKLRNLTGWKPTRDIADYIKEATSQKVLACSN